jgi:hypothetical protein
MSIQQLTTNEISEVTGAGLIGNSIQAGTNFASGLFNATMPAGKALSLIPGVGAVHFLGDAFLLSVTDFTFNLGGALGGNLKQQKMHFADELADGTYNPAGFLKYLQG